MSDRIRRRAPNGQCRCVRYGSKGRVVAEGSDSRGARPRMSARGALLGGPERSRAHPLQGALRRRRSLESLRYVPSARRRCSCQGGCESVQRFRCAEAGAGHEMLEKLCVGADISGSRRCASACLCDAGQHGVRRVPTSSKGETCVYVTTRSVPVGPTRQKERGVESALLSVALRM